MNYLFRGLSLLFILSLLWKCGEPTAPVIFTAAQTERLLGSDSAKTWKKIELINKRTGLSLECKESIWTFFSQKDSLSFTNLDDKNCDPQQEFVYAQYIFQNKENLNYLKFYMYGTAKEDTEPKDTITRVITSITDKEFTTEVNLGSTTYIEKFQAR
ncbi:MAG TPA: hypothetical protein VD908_07540 [Cytophagales bacterium]|nr:hypothetical protein [Cytophagales bacterium]